MKRSEWYKEEQRRLIGAELPIAAKDYIQGVIDRGLLACGTIYEKRTPDEDLKAAFDNNTPSEFKLDDIDNILAEIAGMNDEYSWFWIVALKDKRFALIDAWCDYTGWDCQSGVSISLGNSADEILNMAPDEEKYSHRKIRVQLKRQLLGLQPFGLYDGSIKDAHDSIASV